MATHSENFQAKKDHLQVAAMLAQEGEVSDANT